MTDSLRDKLRSLAERGFVLVRFYGDNCPECFTQGSAEMHSISGLLDAEQAETAGLMTADHTTPPVSGEAEEHEHDCYRCPDCRGATCCQQCRFGPTEYDGSFIGEQFCFTHHRHGCAASAPAPDDEVETSLVITDPDIDLLDLLDEAARAMHDAAEGDFVDVRPLQREALAAWLKQRDKQAAQHTAAAVDAALVETKRSVEAMATASQFGPHRRAGMQDAVLRIERVRIEFREGQR